MKKKDQDKGLPVNYDKFVSAQDDGRVWKKIIKMCEIGNFVLWQITFLTWEKISQKRFNWDHHEKTEEVFSLFLRLTKT